MCTFIMRDRKIVRYYVIIICFLKFIPLPQKNQKSYLQVELQAVLFQYQEYYLISHNPPRMVLRCDVV